MPRPFNKVNRDRIDSGTDLGSKLARACLGAKIPAGFISPTLNVSSTTIYGWFHGKNIKEANRCMVEGFVKRIERDMDAKLLPAKTPAAARAYLATLSGVSFSE